MNRTVDDYFDCLVFIGRFQPFHAGHLSAIRAGLEQCGLMLVMVGSARQPRNIRNPWNGQERAAMIRGSLLPVENNRIQIVPVPDDPYDDAAWARELQGNVDRMVKTLALISPNKPRIGLLGDAGIDSGYCPILFSGWERLIVPRLDHISSSAIREQLFGAENAAAAQKYLSGTVAERQIPAPVIRTLREFCAGQEFAGLKGEYGFMLNYHKAWRAAPYPPVFVTADAVVTHGRHILLIQRDQYPGRGLWALPGGFINQHELLVDACIRELLEETRLALTAAVLKDCIRSRQVFDYPYRSLLGRIITHACHFDLGSINPLPAVSGGDDARHARWTPLQEIDPVRLHDDHYFIIRAMAKPVNNIMATDRAR